MSYQLPKYIVVGECSLCGWIDNTSEHCPKCGARKKYPIIEMDKRTQTKKVKSKERKK